MILKCLECNHELVYDDKEIKGYAYAIEFYECPDCGQVYSQHRCMGCIEKIVDVDRDKVLLEGEMLDEITDLSQEDIE